MKTSDTPLHERHPTNADILRRAAAVASSFRKIFWMAAALLCAGTLLYAWKDHSWGALFMALVGAPLANLILIILGVIGAVILRWKHPSIPAVDLFPTIIVAPLLSAIINLVATFLMPLHGC
ncbi:hypothetical protein EV701_120152 [Chthoniobacter flavus]|nr:hypothetical protein [Chthoniobacter flavus]TCO87853.1 hypothetical protein EV701_120152 [Chthoniobacter flavus]